MKRKRKVRNLRNVQRWSMTAAAEAAGDREESGSEDFHAIIAIEETWSSDGRMFASGSLTPREGPNFLPLMGLIETTEQHDRAVSIGHFTRVEKHGNEWHGWGPWSTDPDARPIIDAIVRGDVTGVSVDAAVADAQYLVTAEDYDAIETELEDEPAEPEPEERVKVEGVDYVALDMPDMGRMRALEAEMLGATVVPFPAIGGCTIEALNVPEDHGAPAVQPAVTAAAPVAPPPDWFQLPGGHRGAYDVVIEEDGRIHGYPAATWSDCHLSYPDDCVTPPRSATDYAYFKVGAVRCSDGSTVKTGPLTLRGGHADRSWSAQRAMAHYDDTDSAFADVNIGEDEHGIWIAGALRPTATAEDVRTAMASGFSGDWRAIGGNHELIALSAVNTPGFRRHASLYQEHGLVASIIIDMPNSETEGRPADADTIAASAAERIASSIGRSTSQRRAALYERVHGKAS